MKKIPGFGLRGRSVVRRHELKLIVSIAIAWTLTDFVVFLLRLANDTLPKKYTDPSVHLPQELVLREINVFVISLIIGYILVRVLDKFLPDSSLWFAFLAKTLILVLAGFVMNFCIYVTFEYLIGKRSFNGAVDHFFYNMFQTKWLVQKMPEWVVLFISTQLALEVNKKYSKGVFLNIMAGKYLQPKEENRIIMFLDLKDSTPIAEKLGHKEYFKFIRDFIYYISAGVVQHDGRVYQYVGDEIVVWWPASPDNARKCIGSLIEARKELNKNAEDFRRKYGILPEYKAGVHAGVVTVGQVGLIKKDVVMSGDTINTAARIRSACTEMNQKFMISGQVADLLGLKNWQTEPLGEIDLKGKNETTAVFALKI